MSQHPKIKPVKSSRFLAHTRSKTCLICGSGQNIQAAHESFGSRGLGTKVSDLWTIPLCMEHHSLEHSMGKLAFWSKHKSWISTPEDVYEYLAVECLKNINEFFANGGKL